MSREKTVFKKHDFKAHEWMGISTKMELVQMLKNFQREFSVSTWRVVDIRLFLQIYNWLYPQANPKEHHIRCIATIVVGW